MKLLRPQPNIPEYYAPVQKGVEQVFFDLIFKPLVTIIKGGTQQKIVLNATLDPLEQAIRTGRVQYQDGVFSGQFSAAISRALRSIGATFDARSAVYRLDPAIVPANIRILASQAAQVAAQTHEALLRELAAVEDRIDRAQDSWDVGADGMVRRVYRDTKSIAKELTVMPDLSDQAKERMKDDYTENINIPIKGWAREQVEKLRSEVEENALDGYRFDSLIDRIKTQYKTTQAKSEFLARQETGLFMAKFRRETFMDAGVQGYSWQARGKGMTRPTHWILHDRIYLYSQPPVVDPRTGRRGNPGEDFNCLCVDRPVLGRVAPDQVGQIWRMAA